MSLQVARVTNKTLRPAIAESQAQGRVTDRMAAMVFTMANKYSNKPNWRGYSFREELVLNAAADCIKACLKFDLNKTNAQGVSTSAFSYLLQTIHNSFLKTLRTEKKHLKIVHDLTQEQTGQLTHNDEVALDFARREADGDVTAKALSKVKPINRYKRPRRPD